MPSVSEGLDDWRDSAYINFSRNYVQFQKVQSWKEKDSYKRTKQQYTYCSNKNI